MPMHLMSVCVGVNAVLHASKNELKLKLNGLERANGVQCSAMNDEAINALDLKICVMNKYLILN